MLSRQLGSYTLRALVRRRLTRAHEPWTEEQVRKSVERMVDPKTGEWRGLIPDNPIQYSEFAADTEWAEIIGLKRPLIAFGCFIGLVGLIYGACKLLVPEQPYRDRELLVPPNVLNPRLDFDITQFKPPHAYKPYDHQWNYIGKFAHDKKPE